MRTQSWLFLIIGFAIGFAGLYSWTKQRAPEVVRATPLPVDPQVPTESLNRRSQPERPPVDTGRVQELQAKIKSDPKDFDSLVELGNLNFEQEKFDESISLYAQALQIRPQAVEVRTDMGTALFYQRRFDDAIAQFKQVLQESPAHAQTLFNLGVAMLHGKNDPKSALIYWERLVETNPNHPQAPFVKEQIRQLKEKQAQP